MMCILNEMFTCPFSRVDTVSVVLDMEWWLAPLGARLWVLNKIISLLMHYTQNMTKLIKYLFLLNKEPDLMS